MKKDGDKKNCHYIAINFVHMPLENECKSSMKIIIKINSFTWYKTAVGSFSKIVHQYVY